MALLTGDSKYVDVLERTLYNGALDGLSLSGDRFFYGNPLACHERGRQWRRTARMVRHGLLPGKHFPAGGLVGQLSLCGGRAQPLDQLVCRQPHAHRDCPTVPLTLRVNTRYPLDGRINITVDAGRPIRHTLRLRIPGWARDQAVPGDLYRFDPRQDNAAVQILVNGKPIRFREEQGYAVLERVWAPQDVS